MSRLKADKAQRECVNMERVAAKNINDIGDWRVLAPVLNRGMGQWRGKAKVNNELAVEVVLIMFAAGALGGLINCYISDPLSEERLSWWKPVVVGVGAAFMVPVFLSMITSPLIKDIGGPALTSDVLQRLLTLAGFCLIAAVTSRAFINSLTQRVLNEVSAAKREAKQANEKATNAEAIAELDKNEPDAAKAAEEETENVSNLTDVQRKIIAGLSNSKYSMRTRHGIAADTGLTYEQVVGEIPQLVDQGLVASLLNSKQQHRWALSENGRRFSKSQPNSD